MFDASFTQPIRLFKLHGSVDYYEYIEGEEEGPIVKPTGNFWFYKPLKNENLHTAIRIDPITKKTIQSFPPTNLVPQFLTGKTKTDIIEGHKIYKPMFDRFKESFKETDKVVIIGYSFRDIHINKILKEGIDTNDFELVNINPGVEFPFRKNYSRDFVRQLKSIEEL